MTKDELELEPKVETTPNAGEEAEIPELEATPEGEFQGDDPLDTLFETEPEKVLAEAKKFRAIAQRHKKPKVELKVEPKVEKPEAKPEKDADYMKKSDFELANQKKAIRLATVSTEQDSEEVKALKTDILENWENVRQLYTARRGKDTPEDIFEDIKDAYLIFNARKPAKEAKADLTLLKANAVGQGSGKTVVPKVEVKQPPNFKIPKQPTEWYKS